MFQKNLFIYAIVLALLCFGDLLDAQTVITLSPVKDNTLYEDPSGSLSNGSGEFLFAGENGQMLIRRALLAFDIAGNIPTGSTITQVSLTLYMSRTIAGDKTVNLHRVLSDWGEGASDAIGNEGGGAPAETGDATWLHKFFDTEFWNNPGGDYSSTSSASLVVGDTAFYTHQSTPELVSDVQSWLDNPSANYGWILLGDESTAATTKRFNSRENSSVERRPQLEITYSAPTGISDLTNNTPDELSLFQNYPNPFNPQTTIEFSLNRASAVQLAVYNVAGQLVRIVLQEELSSGMHRVIFDASRMAAGIYYYQLRAGTKSKIRKMVVIR